MNGNLEVVQNESAMYQMKFEKEEIPEDKIVDREIVAKAIKTDALINNENRFARLKRNLRKRSISIL